MESPIAFNYFAGRDVMQVKVVRRNAIAENIAAFAAVITFKHATEREHRRMASIMEEIERRPNPFAVFYNRFRYRERDGVARQKRLLDWCAYRLPS